MCKNKNAIKGSLLHFVAFGAAIFISTLIGGNAFAATTDKGIITDPETDIRWEYELVTDTNNAVEPQVLTIRFYDKPATETTVTVPSLSDLISLVPNATNDLDTYFLKDADTAAQNTAYSASYPLRTPEMDTTVLDMTSTSKIQIRGVKPIIDPDIETELIFGENMVIGDTFERGARTYVYNRVEWYESSWGGWWNTYGGQDVELDFESIPGWKDMTLAEKINYKPTIADFGCIAISDLPHDYVSEEGKCYIYGSSDSVISSTLTFHGGAFSGYRLKLTNFEEENFNYIGYQTFKDSILDDAHTTMTITGDAFAGGFIFQNTNIEKAIINTNTYGTGLFKDCQSLTEFTIGNGVDHIEDDTFAATGLGGSISFANMGIKTIGARAFEDDNFTEINFESINRINYAAFRNNDLRELYLPKSINYLQSYLFENNNNIKKLTVAYDTLTSGTTLPLWVVISGHYNETSNDPVASIEEVNVIAPYAANEPVSATHVTYDDYRWGFNTWNQEHTGGSQPNGWGYNSYGTVYHGNDTYKFEDDYADVDSKKNIIAPLYFAMFKNLKKITIGEGYEYVGSSAFWHTHHTFVQWPTQQKPSGLCDGRKEIYDSEQGWIWVDYENEKCNVADESRYLEEINLPSTLKGVGNLSFEGSLGLNMKVNLPDSLEFIGIAAFGCLYHMGGDFDLPNVKYIGDFAFNGTSLRDIAVHNTVVYWGDKAFSNIPTLRNITLDVDLFDPDRIIPWTRVNDPTNYDPCHGEQYFRMQFGEFEGRSFSNRYDGITPEVLYERWGIREVDTKLIGTTLSRFGKITFTENVVHMMPQMDQYADSSSSWDVFFGYTTADEVDMSAMPWKILPRKFFNRTEFGKVTLPQNLEIIGHHAFVSTIIDEELVIPDSVKIIGAYAFESWENISRRSCRWDSELQKNVCTAMPVETIKITKLPTSLEYVGYLAFWGDRNLTADLNAPNLKFIGSRAFMNTGIRDVLLPNGLSDLREAAFAMNPNLRNITIDVNLSDIYTSQSERDGLETYSYPEYFLEWAGSFETASVEINSTYQHSRCDYYDEQLANGYYDQHPDYLQYADDACKEERPFQTFYTIFNQNIETLQDRWGYDYEAVKANQNESGDTYGTLTFGPHATTELDSMIGAFSGLTFEKVDLSQTGWKKLTKNTDAFYESKIGTLILPQGIETINYASFMKAEITNPITIPASVRTIDTSAFQWAKIGGLDIKEGLETINSTAFLWSTINGEFSLPSTLRTIGANSFMEVTGSGKITNMLPEGVETVGNAAFYQSDLADNLVIPSTVTTIQWSAFNANNVDVHYDKVTIKPDLTYESATNQLVHQMFWKVDFDELVVESNMLVGLDRYADSAYYQEFYNLKMDKVTITNLPKITRGAFDKCHNLVEVDLSKDANLDEIKTEAFLDDEKLHIIKFSPAIKNKTVTLGQRILVNTAFETMGDSTKEFDLTAAKFVTPQSVTFAWMPKLRTVDIPNGFNNNVIEMATFYNDPELKEVTVGYKISLIDEGAFANDTKIEKIFIWGNTVVNDSSLDGYEAPSYFGRGGDGDDVDLSNVNPDTLTIPGQADVYAYSVSPTEAYASYSRDAFEGTFYPLDEVLYLTSNKPTVLINDDETDFDKSNLIVYGLRRDGVVLESDNWAEYDGVAFARSAKPLTFEKMADTIAENPDFGTV
ncbi:leucine-rich repeat protein, partial [Candidatus Saccharibacteria bacterium]|nr:leucine-rich repeat protein [Candidatus Saccharibacteria bacterium]